MRASTSHKNPHLIPKVTVDVNGYAKTVWVKPDEAGSGTLNDLPPVMPDFNHHGERVNRIGPAQGSLFTTKEERILSAERGYGTEKLSEAAQEKFHMTFGCAIEDAPPVELSDERMYDYIAKGLNPGQAREYARYGIEHNFAHPKLDAEYAFVSGPKVAKIDLAEQKAFDSHLRKKEFLNINITARALQMEEIAPEVAADAIANGLRKEHLNTAKTGKSIEDVVAVAATHNVESQEFKDFMAQPNEEAPKPKAWASRMAERAGIRIRRAMVRSLRRRGRRLYNAVARRWTRFLKLAFLPWKTR